MNETKSVKLELNEEQLNMMVYMLGAIDLRTEPKTLEIAMDLRKKLSNALEVFKPKNKPTTDKYGKPMSDEEIEKARALAAQAAPARPKFKPTAWSDDFEPNHQRRSGRIFELR